VFGVDIRDEGAHCIMDDIKYGTFGWCWTNAQMDSWGSCNETCPLFGPLKVLEDKIDELRRDLLGPTPAPSNTTMESANTVPVPEDTPAASAVSANASANASALAQKH